jgi:hypothetical protein
VALPAQPPCQGPGEGFTALVSRPNGHRLPQPPFTSGGCSHCSSAPAFMPLPEPGPEEDGEGSVSGEKTSESWSQLLRSQFCSSVQWSHESGVMCAPCPHHQGLLQPQMRPASFLCSHSHNNDKDQCPAVYFTSYQSYIISSALTNVILSMLKPALGQY